MRPSICLLIVKLEHLFDFAMIVVNCLKLNQIPQHRFLKPLLQGSLVDNVQELQVQNFQSNLYFYVQ